MSSLSELAEKIISKLDMRGADEVEFYGLKRKLIQASISDSKIIQITEKSINSYGVRIAIGKRISSYSSEDLSPTSIDKMIDRMIRIAKVSREDKHWKGFARGYSMGPETEVFDEKIVKISHEELVELISSAIELSISSAKKAGASEASVTGGNINTTIDEIMIANSHGEEISGKVTAFNLYYYVKSSKNGKESTYNAIITQRNLDEKKIMEEAERAGERSVKFMNVKSIKSGKYQILFMPKIMGSIIGVALAPAFSALNIQQNRSPLKGKLGKEVLSPQITIVDDPYIPWGYGSRNFDDEGIATTKKRTVTDGILKSILYDYYTASRENKSSTGNGVRRSLAANPQPTFINLIVETKDKLSMDELISNIKRGIIVYDTIGQWMSNPVNGGVQATITHGLYIENGEIKHAVKGAVLGGNIYKMLKENYVGASKTKENIENIYSPAILTSEVDVAGE
ncbi:MAG: TldD/PmbA family protein [archaeon GB-1867-005]|nr:TldD/PmbA family protein [Candidatus Culexmicrobium cathedralense]